LRAGIILAVLAGLAAQARAAAPKVVAADMDGVVHPITAEIIAGAIAQARQENAALIVIRLNTPAG
jgi:membrane-bound ClpP family serine protease